MLLGFQGFSMVWELNTGNVVSWAKGNCFALELKFRVAEVTFLLSSTLDIQFFWDWGEKHQWGLKQQRWVFGKMLPTSSWDSSAFLLDVPGPFCSWVRHSYYLFPAFGMGLRVEGACLWSSCVCFFRTAGWDTRVCMSSVCQKAENGTNALFEERAFLVV